MLHSLLYSYYVRQSVSSRTNAKACRLYWSTLRKLSIGSHMTGYFGSLPPCRSLWNVGWYRDFNNVVKWNGTLSHTFPTCIQDEGNDALLDIQAQHIGAIIGTVCCAVPTCADDAHRINGIGRSVYPVKYH